jgi:hypothetical protein
MVIQAFGSRRQAIHHRLCDNYHCQNVPFHCELASRWKCPRVSLHVLLNTILRLSESTSAGSNPNLDFSTEKYATEYRIEYFRPPYYTMSRPSFKHTPQTVNYGDTFTITVSNPGKAATFKGKI